MANCAAAITYETAGQPANAADYLPRPGPLRIYWCHPLSGHPARAELDAGIDLTEEIIQFTRPSTSGFTITFSNNARELRTLIPCGSEGHILFLPVGDRPGCFMDNWPVKIKRYNAQRGFDPMRPDLVMDLAVNAAPQLKTRIPWPTTPPAGG